MVSGAHKHAALSRVSYSKGTSGGLDAVAVEFEASSPSRVSAPMCGACTLCCRVPRWAWLWFREDKQIYAGHFFLSPRSSPVMLAR